MIDRPHEMTARVDEDGIVLARLEGETFVLGRFKDGALKLNACGLAIIGNDPRASTLKSLADFVALIERRHAEELS